MAPHILYQYGHGYSFTTQKLKSLAENQAIAQIPLWPLGLFRDTPFIFQEECLQRWESLEYDHSI